MSESGGGQGSNTDSNPMMNQHLGIMRVP